MVPKKKPCGRQGQTFTFRKPLNRSTFRVGALGRVHHRNTVPGSQRFPRLPVPLYVVTTPLQHIYGLLILLKQIRILPLQIVARQKKYSAFYGLSIPPSLRFSIFNRYIKYQTEDSRVTVSKSNLRVLLGSHACAIVWCRALRQFGGTLICMITMFSS